MGKFVCRRDNQHDFKAGEGTAYLCYLYLDDSSVAVGQNYRTHLHQKIYPYMNYSGMENYSYYEHVKDIPASVTHDNKSYTVKKVAKWAFYSALNVSRVTLPSTIEEIEEEAFTCESGLSTLELNEGLKIIGKEAFYHCVSLIGVTIPDSVTAVGRDAFTNCQYMTKATIGAGITSLDHVFFNCEKLCEVTCRAVNPPVITEGTFSDNTYRNAILYVPFSSLEDYKKAAYWKEFNVLPIPETVPQNNGNAVENDPPAAVEPILITEPIRYITLRNDGLFTASIRVKGSFGSCVVVKDIRAKHQKTVDLADDVKPIKEGDEIEIEIVVLAGKNKTAKEHFVYSATSNKKADYIIKGTTLINSLTYRGINE